VFFASGDRENFPPPLGDSIYRGRMYSSNHLFTGGKCYRKNRGLRFRSEGHFVSRVTFAVSEVPFVNTLDFSGAFGVGVFLIPSYITGYTWHLSNVNEPVRTTSTRVVPIAPDLLRPAAFYADPGKSLKSVGTTNHFTLILLSSALPWVGRKCNQWGKSWVSVDWILIANTVQSCPDVRSRAPPLHHWGTPDSDPAIVHAIHLVLMPMSRLFRFCTSWPTSKGQFLFQMPVLSWFGQSVVAEYNNGFAWWRGQGGQSDSYAIIKYLIFYLDRLQTVQSHELAEAWVVSPRSWCREV